MDLAVTLIKSVMRAFYQTREILVIDALILHEALQDDDLAYLISINIKDLHKICGKLREDRLLTMQELREGNPRPSNRTWYYINYRHSIDAIKWRMFTIDKEVQGNSNVVQEKKEYFCTFCQAEWTAMEVLDHVGPQGFLCHRCHHTLQFEAERHSGGHELSTRLNNQFKFMSVLLPKIDAVQIPDCDFDRALSKARPVVREVTHQRAQTVAAPNEHNRPMTVKGLADTGPKSIAVNISTSAGPSEAEKAAEKARKEKIARQNALPSWMSKSTVTGESFSGPASKKTAMEEVEKEAKAAAVDRKVDGKASAQIDDIFARLKAEKEAARKHDPTGALEEEGEEEEEEEEEEDDGEDDEFEDVPASGDASQQDAPGTSAAVLSVSNRTKRPGEVQAEAGGSTKRVKLDLQVDIKVEPAEAGQEEGELEDEDEDEDEVEFEDV